MWIALVILSEAVVIELAVIFILLELVLIYSTVCSNFFSLFWSQLEALGACFRVRRVQRHSMDLSVM